MTLPLEIATDCSLHRRLHALAEQIRQCETARRPKATATISTGYDVLDRALSDGGFHRGTLVEWLTDAGGSGATTLVLSAARQACGDKGTLVVINRRRTFYPLAAVACGIDLSRLLLVRPQNDRDETWAIDQALRSGGASAVVAWPEKLDDHLFRRLQLAAESGGTLGLFVRPVRAIAEPSWAEVRLLVEPLASVPSDAGNAPRRARVTVLRCPGRGAINAQRVILHLEDPSQGEVEPQRIRRLARRRIA
jgi:cell division inhibitor SulA/protein ImuA